MPARRVLARAAALLAALVVACRDVAAPLPPGAVRITPPSVYARWWALTEACAGLQGDFSRYAWYVAPGPSITDNRGGQDEAWTEAGLQRVAIAADYALEGGVVRHEMLHAILGPRVSGHPPAFFQGRCAGVVDCHPVGCADEGRPPVTAPADAPALPLSALDVGLDLLGNPTTRSGADSVVSLVLRVRNPSGRAVRVPLDATPDLHAPLVHTYGLRIAPIGHAGVHIEVSGADTAGRVPFGAGETRRNVIDVVGVSRFVAGDYEVTGTYNARQVAETLHVAP